jgi:hypothetical protein
LSVSAASVIYDWMLTAAATDTRTHTIFFGKKIKFFPLVSGFSSLLVVCLVKVAHVLCSANGFNKRRACLVVNFSAKSSYSYFYQEPILLRLLNLQLKHHRCSRLESFFK